MPTKYGNVKTTIDGIRFDSKHEATRWCELKYMERAGLIRDLRRQVRFELIPSICEDRKVVQRAVNYIADFVYIAHCKDEWYQVVEDAKGVRTGVYLLKKKLMRWRYHIEIKEV